MHRNGSRRRFLGQLGVVIGALGGASRAAASAAVTPAAAGATSAAGGVASPPPAEVAPPAATDGPGPWFPRQDPALVERVVGVAHRDLDAVRALVELRPELAKAQWDWGFGDWESPLDAASHVGRPDIALYLLGRGARPTIFAAAMLGQLDVVKAFVAASPGIQSIPGPHGIPLLAHAKAGGPPAAAVLDYLEHLGGAGGAPRVELRADELAACLGSYRFGVGSADLIEVAVGSMGLALTRSGRSPRVLVHLGGREFHPAGAPGVKVRFAGDGPRASTVWILEGDQQVRAERIAS